MASNYQQVWARANKLQELGVIFFEEEFGCFYLKTEHEHPYRFVFQFWSANVEFCDIKYGYVGCECKSILDCLEYLSPEIRNKVLFNLDIIGNNNANS